MNESSGHHDAASKRSEHRSQDFDEVARPLPRETTDQLTDMELEGSGCRRPPKDASFTQDDRGAYGLLRLSIETCAANDDVDDGDIGFDSVYSQRRDSREAAAQWPDNPELSWDWNNGRWATRAQGQQDEGQTRAKIFTVIHRQTV